MNKKTRKQSLCLTVLCLLVGSTWAQSGGMDKHGCRASAPGVMATENGASCMPVGRSGDPFVFCTEGVPEHCWWPINPIAGTYGKDKRCFNPMWINTYTTICPRAVQMGSWTGTKPANMTPFNH